MAEMIEDQTFTKEQKKAKKPKKVLSDFEKKEKALLDKLDFTGLDGMVKDALTKKPAHYITDNYKLKKLNNLKSAIQYGDVSDNWVAGCYGGNLFNDWRQSEFDTLEKAVEEAIYFISQGEKINGIVKREKKFGTKWALRTGSRFYQWEACKERLFDLIM